MGNYPLDKWDDPRQATWVQIGKGAGSVYTGYSKGESEPVYVPPYIQSIIAKPLNESIYDIFRLICMPNDENIESKIRKHIEKHPRSLCLEVQYNVTMDKMNPLQFACYYTDRHSSLKIVKLLVLLVDEGVANYRNENMALYLAITGYANGFGSYETIEYLLDTGHADKNFISHVGWTPIILACQLLFRKNMLNVIKLLLSKEVNIDHVSISGTAYDILNKAPMTLLKLQAKQLFEDYAASKMPVD